ncbi:MAG: DUF3370 domain-containing protein, partial [Armatimonadota bacterium]|nr:DUF3370 domain-containing protein [Armatimonadota bacterium]
RAEEGLRPDEIAVRRDRRDWTILVGGQRIVQIDKSLANAHRSDPQRLARTWADNLSTAFGRPYLSVRPIVVPVGETRTAAIKGNVVGPVSVMTEAAYISASYDAKNKAVRVVGYDVGHTELVVSDDRSSLRVPVRSAKYAARLIGSAAAGVTGSPASADTIRRAVEATVAAEIQLEPGAWASISARVDNIPPLRPGSFATVPVHVSASGQDYLAYRQSPVVTVHNEAVPMAPVDVLMVSNSPERLMSHGLWFEGSLTNYRSARLLYHHVNSTGVPSDLVIEAVNLGDRTGRLHLIAGKGGPNRDESWAGHRGAREFLGNRAAGIGWTAPVPPGQAVPLFVQHITPGATVSGILEIRALGPGDFSLRCYLSPPRSSWLPYRLKSYSPSPFLGRWQYPQPRREIGASYVVGREWAFIDIGDQAITGMEEGDKLAGSYGVIYDIALELRNPTAEPAPVEILMEPGGGTARGTVIVDGRFVETSLLRRDSESSVARYTLAPGEVRTVRIETMPQGGSNYPVRLVARPK